MKNEKLAVLAIRAYDSVAAVDYRAMRMAQFWIKWSKNARTDGTHTRTRKRGNMSIQSNHAAIAMG
jgi:hypothetical protein